MASEKLPVTGGRLSIRNETNARGVCYKACQKLAICKHFHNFAPQFGKEVHKLAIFNAYHSAISPKRKKRINVQIKVAGTGCLPATPRSMYSGVYHDAEEAKLSDAKSSAGAPNERTGSKRVHSGGRPQPAGALYCADSRR